MTKKGSYKSDPDYEERELLQNACLRDCERHINELGNLLNKLTLDNRDLRQTVGGLRTQLARRRLDDT